MEEEKENPLKGGLLDKWEQKRDIVDWYFNELDKMLMTDRVGACKFIAIGLCGLDYKKLHVSDKQTQRIVFKRHFDLAKRHDLPMYFVCNEAHQDFMDLVWDKRNTFKTGVVHSFRGSFEQMQEIVEAGLYIGISGNSLQT